jgi:hypothetical protein
LKKSLVQMETIDNVLEYHEPYFDTFLNTGFLDELYRDQIREYEKYGMISAIQSITCAIYNHKVYIIDGHHRIAMFKKLKDDTNVNLSNISVPVIMYNVTTIDELKTYYHRINNHHPVYPLYGDRVCKIYDFFLRWKHEKKCTYTKIIIDTITCPLQSISVVNNIVSFVRMMMFDKKNN